MLKINEEKRRRDIATTLYYLRFGRALKQPFVQEQTGITQHQLSNYENGNALPSLLSAIALADLYDVSLDYITCRNDNPYSHKTPKGPMKYLPEEES